MTGKINDQEKYGGLSQNPPNYPGHEFTGGRPFKFFFRGQQIFNRNFCFLLLVKEVISIYSYFNLSKLFYTCTDYDRALIIIFKLCTYTTVFQLTRG